MPDSPAPGRVLIAPNDGPTVREPTWMRLDDDPNFVTGYDYNRGKQTEDDTTDESTATVYFNDTEGILDPYNPLSDLYGALDGIQIMLQLKNPISGLWVPQYRGHIDNIRHDLHPSQVVTNVQFECTDMFSYLEGIRLLPGLFGDPGGAPGVVFYDNTDWHTHMTQLLDSAFTDVEWYRVFTGNIDTQAMYYNPDDSLLTAIRDAVDAEWPGLANVYTDKTGRVCAHGRRARFDPDATKIGTDWEFTRWRAGDKDAIIADGPRAQIRPSFRWSRDRKRIVNAAMCWPMHMEVADRVNQIAVDGTSKDRYGYRPWSAPDLLVEAGTTTGLTAAQECRLYADSRILNYKDPQTRVDDLTFRSIHPDDSRAEATWDLICKADISDIVEILVGYPGGAGMDEPFFIEGMNMEVRPLWPGDGIDDVTLNLEVSSSRYYNDDTGLFG